MQSVKRGDIYYADLSPVVGSEQGGLRPVLIIQNDIGNRYSPTVIAAAITSRLGKTKLPTHIDVYAERAGLAKDSVILLEQIRTLDKRRLKEKMGHLDEEAMQEVDNAIAVSFGLDTGSRTRTAVQKPHPGFSQVPAVASTGRVPEDGSVPGGRWTASGRSAPLTADSPALGNARALSSTQTGNEQTGNGEKNRFL